MPRSQPVPLPCDHCVDQTRVPDTIRFVSEPGILMIGCFYCKGLLPWEVVSALGGLSIRTQRMADVANGVINARPLPEEGPKIKPMKIKKRKVKPS